MKKKIISIVLFFASVIIGYFYLNTILLPVKIKATLISSAQEYLSRKVSIEKIAFTFNKGFCLRNVEIFRQDDQDRPLLTIPEASVTILLIPLIKSRKIIIANFKIDKPFIFIKKISQEEWNVSDIIKKTQEIKKVKRKAKSAFSFLCQRLIISEGKISYHDISEKKTFSEVISNINLRVAFMPPGKIDCFLDAQMPGRSFLKAVGNYKIKKKEGNMRLSFQNMDLGKYQQTLSKGVPLLVKRGMASSSLLNVSIEGQRITTEGDVEIKDCYVYGFSDKKMAGEVIINNFLGTFEKSQIKGKGRISITDGDIDLGDDLIIKGSILSEIDGFSFSRKGINASGDIMIKNALVNLQENRKLTGELSATEITLSVEDKTLALTGDIAMRGANFIASKNQVISGDISLDKIKFKNQDKNIFISGGLNLSKGKIIFSEEGKLTGNIKTQNTSLLGDAHGVTIKSDMDLKEARVDIGERRFLEGAMTSDDIHITFGDEGLSLGGQFKMKDLSAGFDRYHFNGNPLLDISLARASSVNKLKYGGSLQMEDGFISGVPSVGAIEEIQGVLSFSQDKIESNQLCFTTDGMDFITAGFVENILNPFFSLNIKSKNIRLNRISSFFPDFLEKYQTKIFGLSSAKIKYEGYAKSFNEGHFYIDAFIKDAKILSEKYPIFENMHRLSGKLFYSNDKIKWEGVHIQFKGKDYIFSGNMINDLASSVEATLLSEEINLFSKFNFFNNEINIDSFRGKYLTSSVETTGKINMGKKAFPVFNLQNKFNLELKQILNIISLEKYALPKVDLEGRLTGDVWLKGSLNDWKKCQVKLKARSSNTTIEKYDFNNSDISYSQRNHKSNIDIKSNIYDGNIKISSFIDIKEETMPTAVSLEIKNLELKEYRKQANLKRSNLSGQLNLLLNAQAELKNISQISGRGTFSIADGLLGEVEIVKGVASVINEIPWQIGNILSKISSPQTKIASEATRNYITEAQGDFIIKDRAFFTDNTILLGSIYDLQIQGSMNFDKHVNVHVYPTYARFATRYKGATEVLGSPVHIVINGPIHNLKYTPIFDPVKPIEDVIGTTLEIFKGAGSILGDIF